MIQVEVVSFIIISILLVINVIVWNWHRGVESRVAEVVNNNRLKEIETQIKKVETDEKISDSKYKEDRAQLEFDLTSSSSEPDDKQ